MKLQYLAAIFVVLVPLAKATRLRDRFDSGWLKVADDACKKTCSQTDALYSPTNNILLEGVKTCTVKFSCNKGAKLPDNTSCDNIGIGFKDPGKCSNGSCSPIKPAS